MMKNLFSKFVRGIFPLTLLVSISYLLVSAHDEPSPKYYQLEIITLEDGTRLNKMIINGPPKPPAGYELERLPVDLSTLNAIDTANTIPGVPAFDWSMGCSATSAAMIAGYLDRTTHPNIYTGPANGGVVPLDNSIWGTWSDGVDTYGQTPLSATRQGLDGRLIKGHIDDYWVGYGSMSDDPFFGNWTEHTYGECTGDYMKTNQTTNFGNADGGTTFYSYTSNPAPFTCSDIAGGGNADDDGTYGWKLFYESRGYTVTDCYNQKTDNTISGGFSFEDYMAEIDAGYPVMIHVLGHTMVGVGYDTIGNTVYLHDTWDYNTHSMTWGGSYQDMEMDSVSIVHLETLGSPILDLIENTDGDGDYLVNWTDVTGAFTYTLQEHNTITFTSPTTVYTDSLSQHLITDQTSGTYYYRVMASNPTQNSEWSNVVSTTVEANEVFIPLIVNMSDSTTEKVFGTVTNDNSPVSGTELLLRYYDGSIWSSYAITTTNVNGDYQFTNLPNLEGDQEYYVRWFNNVGNSDWLYTWACWSVDINTTDPEAYRCNFDIGNINLVSPSHASTISLPYAFTWEMRPVTSDDYELNLADMSDGDPWWWTDPSLGYVNSYIMSSLPAGFVPGQQYGWWMWVYGPDGYGESYYYRSVTFNNSGSSANGNNYPMQNQFQKESIEVTAPPQPSP